MMSKSLNYAYPRKYAEGGDVAPDTRQRLEFTPSDDSGNSFRYVLYDDKGREAQAGVTQREYVESGLFGPGTDEKYNVSFLEQAPAPLPPEPETPTASEQKNTSYAFMDADGNSYNMGDARPGHDGTSLERAIANVQEYYDFAPGSFTVSVPSEKRLVGTYDSGSGSFQAATSDMRDLNGFGPGVDLMRPVPDAPVFGGPVQPVVSPPDQPVASPPEDPILYFGPDEQPVYGGIFPDQPVVSPPPIVQPVSDPQARTYFPFDRPAGDPGGSRTYGPGTPGVTYAPPTTYTPPPVQPVVPESIPGVGLSPVNYGSYQVYSPPGLPEQSAADTRAAGYNATLQRFANSPFVRPEGIMGLQLGGLKLS